EETEGEKVTDPRYGAFLVLTLIPVAANSSVPQHLRPPEEDFKVERAYNATGLGCSCPKKSATCRKTPPFPLDEWPRSYRAAPAALRRRAAECDGSDVLLGISVSLPLCLQLCREVPECQFVAYGIGKKRGQCHWEINECLDFEDDSYLVF
ncbi:unnamed protein product, partial [Symbiodinium necroappetens]